MKTISTLAVLSLLALVACDKSASEAQQEANKAQAKANTETTNAQIEASKTSANAQSEADQKIAKAQAAFNKTREDFRHDEQAKLDELDKKIADLDAKAKKETGKTKAKLDASLPSIHTQRDAFARDFATLQNDTPTSWDASKKRIENEWDALKAAVDKVD